MYLSKMTFDLQNQTIYIPTLSVKIDISDNLSDNVNKSNNCFSEVAGMQSFISIRLKTTLTINRFYSF